MERGTMKKTAAWILTVLLVPVFLHAANTDKRAYQAKPINPHPPVIDGLLNDPSWEKVEWGDNFIQREPYEGKEPSQETAFKILYDNKNIYVAVRAHDTKGELIEKRLSRRDSLEGDWVEVNIDSYFDKRTAFSFAVNAAGVKRDLAVSNNGEIRDLNWDPIWYVKTASDEQGWTAEMRIPLSQLRFANSEELTWGLQITRSLFRKDERSDWQFIPKDSPGWVHLFGELHGLKDIKPPRQIELTPYSVGRLQYFQQEAGNPFATGNLRNMMGGLDGKIGITSDLTLNFTINPDFGQVEADPSVVNLTAFETYYEEKRPFFIEGRNILSFPIMIGDGDFSSDNLFYSRRIGRSPQRRISPDQDEYIDTPENTSILGAFKLTGKTKNGISMGVINSITGRENAQISHWGLMRSEIVEPLTNYFGLRLQKDYNEGNTIIGSMVTATNRNLQSPDLDFLHKSAYSGGIDFEHNWKDRTYYLAARLLFSHVRGSTEALTQTQESPLRYFQRPDADHIHFDPTRTSLTGHGGTVFAGKGGNSRLNYMAGVTWRSPGLELNDMGYQHYADTIMQWTWAGYRIWEPFSIFREIGFNFNQWRGWNFSGANIFDGGNIGMWGQFKNYMQFNLGFNRSAEALSSTALRGGPSLRVPGGWNIWYNLSSDSRKRLRFNLGGSNFIGDQNNRQSSGINFGGSYRPNSALSISVNPSYNHSIRELQYIGKETLASETRYLFGRIHQKTLGVTMRLNVSLTPDLSIQFYGQPFVSAGKFSQVKNITEPRADLFTNRFHIFNADEIRFDQIQDTYYIDEDSDGVFDYSISNPNFNFLQFRSNLVLRWEYIPGSALYLVWSQGRTGYLDSGDFSFRNDMQDLFHVHPHNVFLVKFSYCFKL